MIMSRKEAARSARDAMLAAEGKRQADDELMRSVPFVRFDPATGEITQHGSMQRVLLNELIAAGEPVKAEAGSWQGHFVHRSGAVRAKSPCPARLDGTVLRDLPVPCRIEIRIDGHAPIVSRHDEPDLALEFAHPGAYAVRVTAIAYLPITFAVAVKEDGRPA